MKNKEVDIQFVGHSTFILDDNQGTRILIDPWLKNNPACPEDLQEPKDIDYILITHGHFDYVGGLNYILNKFDTPVFIHKDYKRIFKL